jgi:hypothetical protein
LKNVTNFFLKSITKFFVFSIKLLFMEDNSEVIGISIVFIFSNAIYFKELIEYFTFGGSITFGGRPI